MISIELDVKAYEVYVYKKIAKNMNTLLNYEIISNTFEKPVTDLILKKCAKYVKITLMLLFILEITYNFEFDTITL